MILSYIQGVFGRNFLHGPHPSQFPPDDIAPAVVFLASADSKWITGETLYVSGGVR